MQTVIQQGNYVVVINQQAGHVFANLYVNARTGIQNANITSLRWSGKTMNGAKSWAKKQFAIL